MTSDPFWHIIDSHSIRYPFEIKAESWETRRYLPPTVLSKFPVVNPPFQLSDYINYVHIHFFSSCLMAIESSSSLPEQGAHIPERTSDETYRTLVLLFDGTGDKYVIFI